MITPRPPPSASPRWPVLVTLVSVVLGLHLVLLAGGVALHLPSTTPANDAASTPATATSAHTDGATRDATSAQHAAAQAVRVSTVRWIVPAPPHPNAAAPAPKVRPAARAMPLPRTGTAAPSSPPALSAPEAAEATTPTDETAPAAQEVTAANDPTPAPDPVSEEPLAINAPAGATDTTDTTEPIEPVDTLLAAATTTRPHTTPVELPPAQPPASTRLQYDVTGNIKGIGYRAQGTLDWTLADGRYDARMEMRVLLLGSRSQTSTGRVGPGGLMPERFADKSRSEKAAHFDAAHQRIRFSNNAAEAPLQAGAQDRLSLFMQLAGLLQARPQAYKPGQTVDMQVAGTGDAPVWRFEIGEESTIQLPAGEFRVRHLVRQPRKEFDSTVEMWLAPSLDHMPVRLRITQSNGDVADQKLSQMP